MQIVVNDEQRDVPDRATVAQLIDILGLGGKFLAIECNRRLVPHADHAETVLEPGDRLEIVTLVGGG